MELVNYISSGKNDIIKLKKELMEIDNTLNTAIDSKSNKEKSDNLSVAEEMKQIMNAYNGDIFEENIREILKYKYNFEKSSFPRNTIYRKIKIKTSSETITLLKDESTKITLNGIKYTFTLNNNHSITIKDSNEKEIETIEKSVENIRKTLNDIKITIFPHVEIEADGIYEINDFNSDIFNKNEVEVIYSNIPEGNKNFEMAILEVKLSKNTISDLVKQIEKDSNVFGKKLKKKIVYIGFINSPNIDSNAVKNFVKLQKISCVVYGIKESKFGGKNVLRPIDWDLVKEVEDIKKNIELLLKLYMEKDAPKKEKKFTNKKRSKGSSQEKKDDNGDEADE